MSMYYVRKKAQVSGPFTLDQLKKMVTKLQVAKFDSISQDGVNWYQAQEQNELWNMPSAITGVVNEQPSTSYPQSVPNPDVVQAAAAPSPVVVEAEVVGDDELLPPTVTDLPRITGNQNSVETDGEQSGLQWCYMHPDQRVEYGPLDLNTVSQLIIRRTITPDTPVKHVSSAQWNRAIEFPTLRPYFG